jgi:hypothetical protein
MKMDLLEKQIAMHSKALGLAVDPARISSVQRAKDGEPYTPEERAPAVPRPDASLNWGGGQNVMMPSAQPAVTIPGQPQVTSTPRCDQGQRSGVDTIVNGG